MPKNIVILFVNDGDMFGSLIRKKMRISTFGSDPQIVKMQLIAASYKLRPRDHQKTLTRRIDRFLNKQSEVESPDEASRAKFEPDPTAVAGAYQFLEQQYKDGDRIILVGVGRGLEECNITRDTILRLTCCLGEGASAFKPPQVAITKKSILSPPIEQLYTTSPMQRQVPINNITLIHHSKTADCISYHNELLDRFPLSVKRFVSINYAPGNDVTCDTTRGASGGVKSREVWFFDAPIWQGSYIIYSTMGYIHYHPQFTNQWLGIKPITTGNLTLSSRSTSLLPAGRSSSVPVYSGNVMPTPPPIASIPAATIFSGKASPTSVAASCQWFPLESDAIETPRMSRLEMRSYRAFRRPEEDDHLPRRVFWRVSYSEAGVPS